MNSSWSYALWYADNNCCNFHNDYVYIHDNTLYQEPMRAEGVQLHIVVVMCSDAKSAKAAPNMAQIEEVYITLTLWSVVILLLWVLDACIIH